MSQNDPWGQPNNQNNQWGNNQPNDNWGQNNQWGQPNNQPVQPPPNYGQQPQQPQFGQQPYGQPQQPYGQQPQQPFGLPPSSGYPGAPVQKRGGCLKIGLIVAGLLVVLCGIGGYFLFNTGKKEIDAAIKVIDSFMVAGRNNDANAAIAQTASGSTTDEDQVRALIENNRGLFEDYQSAKFGTNVNIQSNTTTGSTISLNGTLTYSSAPTNGTFEAELVREADGWKIQNINIRRQ